MNKYQTYIITAHFLFTLVVLLGIIYQNVDSKKTIPYFEENGSALYYLDYINCTHTNNLTFIVRDGGANLCEGTEDCSETLCQMSNRNMPTYHQWVGFMASFNGRDNSCHPEWHTTFKITSGTILWIIASICFVISFILCFAV